MELKDFIKNALINIVEGVEEANKKYDRFRLNTNVHNEIGSGQTVDFDVSVIVDESSKEGQKTGIFVVLANLGGGKSTNKDHSETSKDSHNLKFKVFIAEK